MTQSYRKKEGFTVVRENLPTQTNRTVCKIKDQKSLIINAVLHKEMQVRQPLEGPF